MKEIYFKSGIFKVGFRGVGQFIWYAFKIDRQISIVNAPSDILVVTKETHPCGSGNVYSTNKFNLVYTDGTPVMDKNIYQYVKNSLYNYGYELIF